MDCLKELEDPDEDQKGTAEEHDKKEDGEYGDEDEVYVHLKAEDWQEVRGSQESPSTLV